MITETTASLGSGINWDGPKFVGGGVTIQVGHEWPGGMQTTHCTGTYEQAREVWEEIVAWADAHGVDISHLEQPADHAPAMAWGFQTEACSAFQAAMHRGANAVREAISLLRYRHAGEDCPRRRTLEAVVATRQPSGSIRTAEDVALFLGALEVLDFSLRYGLTGYPGPNPVESEPA